MRLFVAVLATASATAFAEPAKPIADGYALAFHDKKIVVQKDKAEARVLGAESLTDVHYDKTTGNVTVDYETESCMLPAQADFTFASLKARVENEPALALHHRKDFKNALAGFQRAIAADPAWNIPAFNAASAQQLLGDRDGAIATLAPWLKKEPIHTYVQIHQDPELAPLTNRPEVKAIETTAGNVEITPAGIKGDIAYSPKLRLVAYTREEGGWGNSQFTSELVIWSSTNDGATIPLASFSETSDDCYPDDPALRAKCMFTPAAAKPLAARAAAAQQLLRQLGFSRVASERPVDVSDDNDGHTSTFKKHGLVLTYNRHVDSSFHVTRGTLTTGTTGYVAGDRIHDARIVDGANVLILWSTSPGSEGCTSTDPSYVQVVPMR